MWTSRNISCLDSHVQLRGFCTALRNSHRSRKKCYAEEEIEKDDPRPAARVTEATSEKSGFLPSLLPFHSFKYFTLDFEILKIDGALFDSGQSAPLMVFHIPALFDIRLSNPLQLSSPAGANQYLFSVLTMCSGIFVPLSEPDHLWKSQHGQKISLIQSLFPADRQLVCNSSMLSPWAVDFCGLSTCWVCGCFSVCMVWVGTHTQNEGCGWQGSPTVFFLEQGR